MVDVGGKPLSRRRAPPRLTVRMAGGTAAASATCRRAMRSRRRRCGILAAKRTSDLIPLCHPLRSRVEVKVEVRDDAVEIVASAETTAQTGVEME